jgi:hypothetical protein
MASLGKASVRSALTGAVLFFAGGVWLTLAARYADLHRTYLLVRGHPDPWLGYLGAVLCFAVAAYGVFLAFRKGRRDN